MEGEPHTAEWALQAYDGFVNPYTGHGFSEQEIVQETDMVRDQVRDMVYEGNWYW